MKPISIEKRQLIVLAKERKEKSEDIAKLLGVSLPVIKLIWRLYKQTGSVEPKKNKGRTSSLTLEIETAIHNRVETEPDITLAELIDDLKLPIKKSQLSRWL